MAKAATPNLDLKRELKEFYKPSARAISVVDVPPISFLMVDGKGDPGSRFSRMRSAPSTPSPTQQNSL